MKHSQYTELLVLILTLSINSHITMGTEAKKTISEPRSQAIEPAPIVGDCPCSKASCLEEKGPKGDKGDTGAIGHRGPKGDRGADGPKGKQGGKGDPGATGIRGSPGVTGKTGSPGKDGMGGVKGDQGPTGPKGEMGPQGPRGPMGHKGDQGPPGPPGKEGPKGDKGIKGERGLKGHTGDGGPQGPTGATGPHGSPGSKGPTGPTGPKGSTGPRGAVGPTGIQGPKGPTGNNGDKGIQGPRGTLGADGKTGPPGLRGLRGERGPKGDEGSCSIQCADIKKQLLREIETLKNFTSKQVKELRDLIDELRPQPTTPPSSVEIGTVNNPGLSCKHIKDKNIRAKSGAYYVLTNTAHGKSRVYCHMENLGTCGGGGWTVVMKLNGNKPTFHYSSSHWSSKVEYQPYYGTSAFGRHETKLATYWSTPFNYICVGMRTAHYSIKFLRIHYKAKSLYDVIADGNYKPFHYGRDAWKRLVQHASLQWHCNKEGFNVRTAVGFSMAARVRIGIIANQENDCLTCDSRIGFGMDGTLCGQQGSNSCGNEARALCSSDNGDRSIKTYGYIFVQ